MIEENSNSLLLWAKFLDAEREKEFDVIAKQDSYIQSAYRQLQVISQDKEKRLEYEAREKTVRDYNQLMKEAEQRGEQRGKQQAEQRINKLNTLLIQHERYDDLKRSVTDSNFQHQLMKEYGI